MVTVSLPSIFRADTKIRLVFDGFSGKLTDTNTGVSLDLLHDLGFNDVGIYWEMMGRVGSGQPSFRVSTLHG